MRHEARKAALHASYCISLPPGMVSSAWGVPEQISPRPDCVSHRGRTDVTRRAEAETGMSRAAGDESSSNRFEPAARDMDVTAFALRTPNPTHPTRREAESRVQGRLLPWRVQGGARRGAGQSPARSLPATCPSRPCSGSDRQPGRNSPIRCRTRPQSWPARRPERT
ncbi:MAG: hypothetical protein FD177_1617 [Desulfovibrionaceae bacterium]|nr:MAG: hypothetical protein FD177_1617 [Desulfovibrionaceae bacterium]